jgi:hypothetical protein
MKEITYKGVRIEVYEKSFRIGGRSFFPAHKVRENDLAIIRAIVDEARFAMEQEFKR